jgi:hypothetical protein
MYQNDYLEYYGTDFWSAFHQTTYEDDFNNISL